MRQALPDDEREAIGRHVRELDRLAEDLAVLDREIANGALEDGAVRRLITITGVNLTVATGVMAAVGDISRFDSPGKLVSYLGLNPRVRQSGLGAAHHGRISKAGRSHARAMLVEAAWAVAKSAGTPARVLRSHPRPARTSDRRRRGSAQAGGALLARPDQRPGLPVGPAGFGRQQDPRHGVAGRPAAKEGQSARAQPTLTTSRRCEIRSSNWLSRPNATTRASSIAGKRVRRRAKCASASIRQGTNRTPGGACSRRAALRHEVARASEK